MTCVVCKAIIGKKDGRSYWLDEQNRRKRYSCWADAKNGAFDKWIDARLEQVAQAKGDPQ